MTVLLWSTIIITIALLVHVFIWRIRLPKRQTMAILYIFSCTIIVGVIALYKYGNSIAMIGVPIPESIFEYLHILIFLGVLTIGYIILYPGFEVDVPTLILVNTIAQSGVNGIEKERLYDLVNDNILIKPRIKDLLTNKNAYIEKGKYNLTPKGILMVKIILSFRKLQRLEQKGG
jgi:hypothetical protein